MKIGLITDTHHPVDRDTKLGSHALDAISQWQAWCDQEMVDLRVDLGDKINETDTATDLPLLPALVAAYDGKAEHIMGNHDNYTLSTAQWEAAFGQSFTSRSFDLNGFHLTFFCPDLVRNVNDDFYEFIQAELDWMENDLASTSLPTIVFTHVPLHRAILDRTLFNTAPTNPAPLHWSNAKDMTAILRASNVFLVCAGHTHYQEVHVEDDIVFLRLQSATDCMVTHPYPSMAMAIVDVSDTKVNIKVRGRDSVQYKMRRRDGNRVWQVP